MEKRKEKEKGLKPLMGCPTLISPTGPAPHPLGLAHLTPSPTSLSPASDTSAPCIVGGRASRPSPTSAPANITVLSTHAASATRAQKLPSPWLFPPPISPRPTRRTPTPPRHGPRPPPSPGQPRPTVVAKHTHHRGHPPPTRSPSLQDWPHLPPRASRSTSLWPPSFVHGRTSPPPAYKSIPSSSLLASPLLRTVSRKVLASLPHFPSSLCLAVIRHSAFFLFRRRTAISPPHPS